MLWRGLMWKMSSLYSEDPPLVETDFFCKPPVQGSALSAQKQWTAADPSLSFPFLQYYSKAFQVIYSAKVFTAGQTPECFAPVAQEQRCSTACLWYCPYKPALREQPSPGRGEPNKWKIHLKIYCFSRIRYRKASSCSELQMSRSLHLFVDAVCRMIIPPNKQNKLYSSFFMLTSMKANCLE